MPKVIKGGGPSEPPRRKPPPSLRKGDRKPIIQKEVVGATAEARRIVNEAEATAAHKIREAEAIVEQIREQAYNEGREAALAEFTKQTQLALEQVEELKTQIEPEYVKLVLTCVEKVLGEEIRLNPDSVIGIVRNALRDATQQREVNVRVHPADVEHLRKNDRKLLDVLARANHIEIREDDNVRRGGCIVVTELGTIDASLEQQLKALEETLDEELLHGDSGRAQFDEDGEEYDDEDY